MTEPWGQQLNEMRARLEEAPDALDAIRKQVVALAEAYPESGWLRVEIGGIFDSNGFEHDACTWYERGLEFGQDSFPESEAPHFCVQYGSTLRNVGRFEASEKVLRSGLQRWPQFSALQFFLGLTLMSQGRSMEALVAFASLSAGSWDTSVHDYRRAIANYLAEELQPAAVGVNLGAVRLHIHDVPKAAAWYGEAFGLKLVSCNDDFALLQKGSSILELARADDKNPSSSGGTVAYWSVLSLTEACERLVAAGAVIFRGPLKIDDEGLVICQMKDPFGGVFGLRSIFSASVTGWL
jgi:predicted enzyme related to lactoylglutathione lyase